MLSKKLTRMVKVGDEAGRKLDRLAEYRRKLSRDARQNIKAFEEFRKGLREG